MENTINNQTYPIHRRFALRFFVHNLIIFLVSYILWPAFSPELRGGFHFTLSYGIFGFILVLLAVREMVILNRFRYNITGANLSFTERGLITRGSSEVPINTIQDIKIQRGLVDRLLGLAQLKIQTLSGGSTVDMKIPGLLPDHASALKNALLGQRQLSATAAQAENGGATRQTYPLSALLIIKNFLPTVILMSLGFALVFAILAAFTYDSVSSLREIPAAMLAVFFIIIGAYLFTVAAEIFYQWLFYKRWNYHLNDDHFSIKFGVIFTNEVTLAYNKIQEVIIQQSLLGRLFGLYDLYLKTALTARGFRGADPTKREQMNSYPRVSGFKRETAQALAAAINAKIKH